MVLTNLDLFRFKASKPLLTLKLADGPTPTARYDEDDAIHASDDAGPLQLLLKDADDVDGPRNWLLSRDPEGPVTVNFTAPYRKTNTSTPPGPRIDLRRDPGGALVGMGMGFIPVPPAPDNQPEEARQDQWSITIDWDIRSRSSDTYAATSLSDNFPYTKVGNPYDLVTRNIFAVGRLHRFPCCDADPSRSFAMYWISPPPWEIADLTHRANGMVDAITSYFNSSEPFRVFLRKSTSGHGGTGGTSSFLLEYSDGSEDEISAHDMGFTLAHEAVHGFALMEPTGPGEWEWYVEGVASYIGAVAAYTQGGWGRQDMIQALNDYSQAYYTSPVVGLGMGHVVEHAWENIHLMRVIYYRGVMFLAEANGLIRDGTKGEKGIEDIVMELYRRKLRGENYRIDEFMDIFSRHVGRDNADEIYRRLWNGTLLVPAENSLAELGLKVVRQDSPMFELGFDLESIKEKVVSGVVRGSRADLAGVRNGDKIHEAFMVWVAADSLKKMMQLTVQRGQKQETIRYWPRSKHDVESYVWVDSSKEHIGEL